jgi:hypothetical protein
LDFVSQLLAIRQKKKKNRIYAFCRNVEDTPGTKKNVGRVGSIG